MGIGIVIAVGLAAYAVFVFVVLRDLDDKWLAEWAAGRGFQILDSRRTLWGELTRGVLAGFRRWPVRSSATTFAVVIRDRRSEVRTGKVLLVRGLLFMRNHVESHWDDAPGDTERAPGEADRARDAIRRYREMRTREQDDA